MSGFARQFSGSSDSTAGAGVVEWEPSTGRWLVDGRRFVVTILKVLGHVVELKAWQGGTAIR